MAPPLSLRCRCGLVRAHAVDVSPASTNHIVCYCRDCRAFARWLQRMDVLDEAGGTDIVQMARSRVVFDHGLEQLKCVKLSPKGMVRWYAACCRTPVGNTVPKLPFIGVIGAFFDPEQSDRRETALRRPVRIHTASSTAAVPPGSAAALPMMLHMARLALTWMLRGLHGEGLYDARTKRPRVTPQVLSTSERDAIRD